uniref:Uncharacterized protein n=1 Tax=Arundo donax TaxID=35708 RepID=A0A0A9BR43_ARUDO
MQPAKLTPCMGGRGAASHTGHRAHAARRRLAYATRAAPRCVGETASRCQMH